MGRDWSEVPRELLEILLSKLALGDGLRFGGVCSSWRSVALEIFSPPWLLLACWNKDGDQAGSCIFNVSSNKLHYLDDESSFGKFFKKYDPFSKGLVRQHGWLIMKSKDGGYFSFINPVTRRVQGKLALPHFDGSFYYNSKIVLSSHPTSANCVVIVQSLTQTNSLEFAEPGDTTWKTISIKNLGYSCDLTYWNGKFYVVTHSGIVAVCEHEAPYPFVRQMDSQPIENRDRDTRDGSLHLSYHLVESLYGELLLAHWFEGFIEVFKLDGITQQWLKVESLGDQALFLSFESSFSLSSSNYPGLQSNCIYYINVGYDSEVCGIYNLGSRIFKPFAACNEKRNHTLGWPSGMWLWFTPTA